MQLVRHLFSYSIVVVVVVMIASGYYYRETLFPNLFPQAGHSMTAGETTAEKADTGKSDTASTTEKPIAADQKMPDRAETATAGLGMSPEGAEPVPVPLVTEAPVREPPVTLESPARPLKQTEATSQTIPANQTIQGAQIATAKPVMPMHEQSAPVPPATQLPSTQLPSTGTGSAPVSQQLQPRDIKRGDIERRDNETIMMARRAYWTGDYDASEQAYQQLIDRHPDEAELQGEIGNVYYAQGKWAQAAAAYAQVVRQLYRTGRIAQADYMLQIVTSLDSELGKQLQREQDSTTGQQ